MIANHIVSLTIIMVFFITIIEYSQSIDYSDPNLCPFGGNHTMVEYQMGASLNCGTVLLRNLTDEQIILILNKHNELRDYIANGSEIRGNPGPQPSAINITHLQWDEELTEVAQRWADQCHFGHDDCRNDERFPVGQNVAYKFTSGEFDDVDLDLLDLITYWYDEVEDFDHADVANFTSLYNSEKVIGHYTQLIWAETTHIGCGSITYQLDDNKFLYLVCNYGPGGNVYGEEIYSFGDEKLDQLETSL